MKQRVGVLFAAYNGLNWIDEQVVSILNQEHVSVHIFISVDLSSDLTYEWCKQLEEVNQNITVLEYGERFGGAAKNFYRLIKDVEFSGFVLGFVLGSDSKSISYSVEFPGFCD